MLLQVLILLLIVGAVLYVVNLLPIDATVKRIVYVVAVVVLAIYLLRLLLPGTGLG